MAQEEKINIKRFYFLFVIGYAWLMVVNHILVRKNDWGHLPSIISILGTIVIITIMYHTGKRITSKNTEKILRKSKGKVLLGLVIFCVLCNIKLNTFDSISIYSVFTEIKTFVMDSIFFLGYCLYLQIIVNNAVDNKPN